MPAAAGRTTRAPAAHQRRSSSPGPSTRRPGRAATAFGRFDATGPLSAADAPFDPSQGARPVDDLRLAIPRDRLDDRRRLLARLDRRGPPARPDPVDRGRRPDARAGLPPAHRRPRRGLRPRREDPRLVARYDTAPLVRPETINRKWKNYNNYVDNAKSLGKLLLLARRLCERGCGFVTVTTNFVWDMHADVNNATMVEGMRYMGPPLDHALSAFIEDLYARGLDEKILLVACGEMGRTPRINAKGGRDHWGNLGPLLLAGGGLPTGRVIGRPTATARRPVGAGHDPAPDRHDPAHALRRRPAPPRPRPAPRVRPDHGRLGADPGTARLTRSKPAPSRKEDAGRGEGAAQARSRGLRRIVATILEVKTNAAETLRSLRPRGPRDGRSKGLGKAMAPGFAEAGADIVISSRHEDELQAAAREIRSGTTARVEYVVADLTRRDDADRLAAAALEAMGRVDILINNAGTNKPQPIDQISDEAWDQLLELNLSSCMALTRALVPP